MASFGFWSVHAAAFFVLLCVGLALWPAAGEFKLGLELTGQARGAIAAAGQESQLFAMLYVMLGPNLAWAMSIVVVVLLLTYLVTSADSAVLVVDTINAAGGEGPKARPHILFWGLALACVVGGLFAADGLGAIKTAMVIGAPPFSRVMVLMGVASIKGTSRASGWMACAKGAAW